MADAVVKRLLSITAGIVAVALSAALYMYYVNPALTLSPEELHLRTGSPYYSGLPVDSVYPATKGEAAYDVKKCAPKVLSSGRTPAQIHFRVGEKPIGLIPVVAFQILESGEVVNIVLMQRSGVRDKDNAALDWVKRTRYNNRPGCGTVDSEVGLAIDFAAR
jgi:hypothetical protein